MTEVSPQPLQLAGSRFPDSPEKAARADLYLRENVKYALGEREIAGFAAVLRAGGGGWGAAVGGNAAFYERSA